MAPRSRFLDLERHDVLFFYGAYHISDDAGAAAFALVFWPVFLVAALLLHLIAPFPHAAAVCAGIYVVAYCFLLDRAARASSAGPAAAPSRPTDQCMTKARYTIGQDS
ncbi:uncharacterized protein C2845_PM11G09070 [Panicum miliaceum]|uniref:Uncharacterized protein n=1 Tax=Panicum miliaceum TaxID=4540 RepID=A0A3L6RQ70_PANMI|nr:uncharacterized protein C2845_PM11G09070 [Panicum miliaceum]